MYLKWRKAYVLSAGDMISPGVQSTNMGRNESTPDLRDQRYAEVAAIQNSLAHLSMPHHSEMGGYGHSTPPPNRGPRSPLLSPSGMPAIPPCIACCAIFQMCYLRAKEAAMLHLRTVLLAGSCIVRTEIRFARPDNENAS